MAKRTTTAPGKPRDTKNPGYREQYGVIAICRHERDQRRVYGQLRRLGLTVRVVVT